MKEMTDRQRTVFELIVSFLREQGVPPTVREIADRLGISPCGVFGHLKALEAKGFIHRGKRRARSLEILKGADESMSAVRLPLVGRIAAGMPVLAVENTDETILVDPSLLRPRGGEFFALRVNGDSMVEAGILEGDLVLCRRQETAENGEIVVALLDDEATLKRFFRDGRGRIRLEPANARLKPIVVKDVTIQGVVQGLIRGYR